MLQALVLVCFIDNTCMELSDNMGLLQDEISCKARITEMITDFVSSPVTPPVISIQYVCKKTKGTNT
jgi:hypothetical protein